MQPTLIDQGLDLMLFGMGTVFVFLTLLVFATLLMSRVVNRLAPAEPETAPGATQADAAGAPPAAVRQAIKLAIAKHRQR